MSLVLVAKCTFAAVAELLLDVVLVRARRAAQPGASRRPPATQTVCFGRSLLRHKRRCAAESPLAAAASCALVEISSTSNCTRGGRLAVGAAIAAPLGSLRTRAHFVTGFASQRPTTSTTTTTNKTTTTTTTLAATGLCRAQAAAAAATAQFAATARSLSAS